ncbi:MAG: hypothetical protein C4523_00680 [Myxococcales bacterium]|nr:MAG: hypothetical protein C4523_00680 [Myxococcales bacterium]
MKTKWKDSSQAFNEGLNHGLGSDEEPGKTAKESRDLRRPLHSPDLDAGEGDGFVPHRIIEARDEADKLKDPIVRLRDERISRELAAGHVPKPWPWFIIIIILTLFDGLLLGPIISNAIHSFKSKALIFLVGLGVALIIAAGGWGVGWAVRAVKPETVGKAIAAIFAAFIGACVGYMIGSAGDGTTSGILIRTALTALSMLAAAVCHFVHTEATEAWGAVRVARQQENQLVAERNALLREIDDYQESAAQERQAFNRAEADRREGLEAGKQARRRWIRPDIKNMVVLLIGLCLVACAELASTEEHSTTVLVVDITNTANREALAERTLERTSLGYGQGIEVYLLGCNGLTPVYRDQIKPINQPQHKQHLQTVKDELAKALKERVAAATDTTCSPITSSLLMLAAEFQLRGKSGESIQLVVSSDFEVNKDKTPIEGQPFADLDVTVVLSGSSGRNLKRRRQALEFVERLFAEAKLTITN